MRIALIAAALIAVAGCKKEEEKATPKATSAEPVVQKASIEPIDGAKAYPFTQAESKLGWVGRKVTGKHEGSFGVFGGIIELVGNDPVNGRVRAEIDMSSLATSPEDLVSHLKSDDFFGVEKFPRANFVSTAVAKTDAGYSVTGNLTLHGVTRALTFPATIKVGENEVTVNAEFAINRKDFGVVYPGKPDDLIADDVALKLEIHAKKKG
jgi:polyisoprenoid-binding protein YceI